MKITFLLPFGSFKYIFALLFTRQGVFLSTPFWEFLTAFESNSVTVIWDTAFYSLLGVSALLKQLKDQGLLDELSTPFWEFLEYMGYGLGLPASVSLAFLLPFGSFKLMKLRRELKAKYKDTFYSLLGVSDVYEEVQLCKDIETFYSLLGVSEEYVYGVAQHHWNPFYSLLGVSTFAREALRAFKWNRYSFYSLLGVSQSVFVSPSGVSYVILTFYSLLGVSWELYKWW